MRRIRREVDRIESELHGGMRSLQRQVDRLESDLNVQKIEARKQERRASQLFQPGDVVRLKSDTDGARPMTVEAVQRERQIRTPIERALGEPYVFWEDKADGPRMCVCVWPTYSGIQKETINEEALVKVETDGET